MKSNIGYLLPPGEAFTDEMACCLVYYPDKKEYRQALVGSLLYLGNWLAWERDEDKRGKDAGLAWKIANELTLECMYMGCLDELQANVAAILALLQLREDCCGDIITYDNSTTYNTSITPGSGDPPEYYGETEVEDWDEWKEYLCHSANLWLDEVISQSNNLETALSLGGLTLGLAGFAVAAIVLFVVGGFLSGIIVMAIVAATVAGYTSNMFSSAADDLEDSRDDIVCAIVQGRSLSTAMETALASGTAWDIFYSQLDYDSAIAILYEGGDGDEIFLDAEKDYTCECEQIGEIIHLFEFDEDDEGWTPGGDSQWSGGQGNPPGTLRIDVDGDYDLACAQLRLQAGVPTTDDLDWVKLHRIQIDTMAQNTFFGDFEIELNHDGGQENEEIDNSIPPTYINSEFFYDPPLKVFRNSAIMRIRGLGSAAAGYADNILFDFDYGTDA